VRHAKHDRYREHGDEGVPEGREAHEQQPDDECGAANAVVQPPAHGGPHNDSYKREERGAGAGHGLGPPEALDEEREGGEAHDVVGEHAQVHEDDEDEVLVPEPGCMGCCRRRDGGLRPRALVSAGLFLLGGLHTDLPPCRPGSDRCPMWSRRRERQEHGHDQSDLRSWLLIDGMHYSRSARWRRGTSKVGSCPQPLVGASHLAGAYSCARRPAEGRRSNVKIPPTSARRVLRWGLRVAQGPHRRRP
jgi:hypothetical protein